MAGRVIIFETFFFSRFWLKQDFESDQSSNPELTGFSYTNLYIHILCWTSLQSFYFLLFFQVGQVCKAFFFFRIEKSLQQIRVQSKTIWLYCSYFVCIVNFFFYLFSSVSPFSFFFLHFFLFSPSHKYVSPNPMLIASVGVGIGLGTKN